MGVSSRADTWLLLRNARFTGERKRLLTVCKQRGSAHSNQDREFVLTDHGIELADVYRGQAELKRAAGREERLAADSQAAC